MREVDRIMVDVYGIDLVRMMENAGRSLAELAITRFHPPTVTVVGNLRGDPVPVTARHEIVDDPACGVPVGASSAIPWRGTRDPH